MVTFEFFIQKTKLTTSALMPRLFFSGLQFRVTMLPSHTINIYMIF